MLSGSDRHTLSQMAHDIRTEDPEFADLMAWPRGPRARGMLDDAPRATTEPRRRQRTIWIIAVLASLAIALIVVGVTLSRNDLSAFGTCLLTIDAVWALFYRTGRPRRRQW